VPIDDANALMVARRGFVVAYRDGSGLRSAVHDATVFSRVAYDPMTQIAWGITSDTEIALLDLSDLDSPSFLAPITVSETRARDAVAVPCTVLNGVQVRSIGHRECLARILTGTGSTASPDFGVITGTSLAVGLPIPHMDLGGVGLVGELACCAGTVGRRGQLGMLLDPSQLQAPPGAAAYPRSSLTPSSDVLIQDALQARRIEFAALRANDPRSAARLDDYQEALWRAEALSARAETLSENLILWRPRKPVCPGQNRCSAAHRGGLSYAVSVGLELAVGQSPQEQQSTLLLRRTLRGPVTSAMLMGAGVRSTRTIQATNDTLDAQPVDLESGESYDGGDVIGYDSLVSGILERMDVDPAEWLPGARPFRGF
jgi:hypothetical protein